MARKVDWDKPPLLIVPLSFAVAAHLRHEVQAWVRVRAGVARALPRVLPPGQTGRVALVFDRASAGLDKVDGTAMMLELLRNDRVELAVELSPGDVQDSRSALERWWPW